MSRMSWRYYRDYRAANSTPKVNISKNSFNYKVQQRILELQKLQKLQKQFAQRDSEDPAKKTGMTKALHHNHQDQQAAVVLTVDAGNISMSTLDLAVAMAASLETRLHGLFIEDEDLLRAASLPFTREISLTTARVQHTDFEKMQQALQSMARQFRNSLEKAAQVSQIKWSFDCVRGSTIETRLKIQPEINYLIVGEPVGRFASAKQYQPMRRILLIENQSPNLVHALNVVLQKFKQYKIEVTTIASAEDGIEEDSALRQCINNADQTLVIRELPREQLAGILSQAGSVFDWAIFSRHEKESSRRLILDNLRCPVIMVS